MKSFQVIGMTSLAGAALFLMGAAALAQQPGMGGGQNAPAQQQPMPGQPGAPDSMAPGTPDTSAEQSASKYADNSFVEDTLKTDNAQVAMSQLAQQKSSSDDVKQFGEKMVQVHTQLDNQLMPLAKQLQVSEPKGPAKKEKQEIAKLETLSGPQFDTEYIQAMAREQQHALKTFQDEAKQSQNSPAAQAAKMDEPVLSQHFQVLQKLAQAHNVPLDNTAKK